MPEQYLPPAPAGAEPETGGGAGAGLVLSVRVFPARWYPITVLVVAGELDLSTRTRLETALGAADARAPGPLIVDLTGVGFCDAGGFERLARPARTRAHHSTGSRAPQAGDGPLTAYAVAGLDADLHRAADLLWDHGGPQRFGDTAAAVSALRAAQEAQPTTDQPTPFRLVQPGTERGRAPDDATSPSPREDQPDTGRTGTV